VGRVNGVSFRRGGTVRLRLWPSKRADVVAWSCRRGIRPWDWSEVHRSAAHTGHEVRDERIVRLVTDNHAFEVLEAAWADQLEFNAIHRPGSYWMDVQL
jgi:hypothetical protein